MSIAYAQPRKQRVINPSLQWRIILVFLSLACIAVLLEATVLNVLLARLARGLPTDGDTLLERVPGVVLSGLLCTAGVFVPLMVLVGIVVTFRIAGPIHRFEQHLQRLLRGEEPGPCQIRGSDEFQELCALLNAYCARVQGGSARPPAAPSDRSEAQPEPPSLARTDESRERSAA
jgi:hypothetical protein